VISVIVPAFNAQRYIAEALQSVLGQISGGDEVIVVDDGSSDETAAIAGRCGSPVRVIRAPHRGISATVNRAIEDARGDLFAFVDADDRWLSGKIEQSLDILSGDSSIDAVFTLVRQFLSPDVDGADGRYAIPSAPMTGLLRGSMVIRARAWHRVGPMETDLRAGEFVSWYARAIDEKLKMHLIQTVLYERRVHGGNTVIRERETASADYLRLIRATVARRRASKEQR